MTKTISTSNATAAVATFFPAFGLPAIISKDAIRASGSIDTHQKASSEGIVADAFGARQLG